MEVLVHHRKSLVLTLMKQRQSFDWVYITIMMINISMLMDKKYLYWKASNNNINLPTRFCLGSMSDKFGASE